MPAKVCCIGGSCRRCYVRSDAFTRQRIHADVRSGVPASNTARIGEQGVHSMSRRNQSISFFNLNPVAGAVAAALSGAQRSPWRRTSVLGVGAMLLPVIVSAQQAATAT